MEFHSSTSLTKTLPSTWPTLGPTGAAWWSFVTSHEANLAGRRMLSLNEDVRLLETTSIGNAESPEPRPARQGLLPGRCEVAGGGPRSTCRQRRSNRRDWAEPIAAPDWPGG